ncbi:hypothetical protein PGT21_025085 [Puccinia graminis f. sp. tritici]|uniref:Uncharacterized protein n=1 Tax=Puccinia graminis f. sp. tritici TaxID=56615 RepID=A0A5B0QBP1_PUCGR|nr:hypothetical protein PGT21_025085 [Puccinia graminis f. sp. tritici]
MKDHLKRERLDKLNSGIKTRAQVWVCLLLPLFFPPPLLFHYCQHPSSSTISCPTHSNSSHAPDQLLSNSE